MIPLYAITDCESTGLYRKGLADDDPSQPHLLQLSCKVVDKDRRQAGRFTRIIKPEGWSIEPEAEAIHGISEAYAHQVGVPIWFVLAELKASVENATMIIGHNMQGFDWKLIDRALTLAGHDAGWWRRSRTKLYDTMEKATQVLRLPGEFGYKFPTLEEAVNGLGGHLFGTCLEDGNPNARDIRWRSKHDAEEDVNATEFVFWQLMERGAT